MAKISTHIAKPVRVITIYTYMRPHAILEKLDAAGIDYNLRPMISNFHGWDIRIQKPRGKGAMAKMKLIHEL